ncbi:response regulator [Telluribacter sp.]|jgi:CheY-like chemotaxis protein|uniref:response regulator n=1 Tax=Telluribacter sp. TaxID=1978767 RepID=UPI002E0F3430|nr:response regulator [Telluribacter sp.]
MHPSCLLIDDDVDEHNLFTFALSQVNPKLECIAISSSTKALEKVRNEPDLKPLFIFIDLKMPRMNGKEVLKEIKTIGHLKDVPTFMYSGSLTASDLTEARQLGSTGCIVKPGRFTKLVDVLKNVVNNLDGGFVQYTN